jgi:hypothetical protein
MNNHRYITENINFLATDEHGLTRMAKRLFENSLSEFIGVNRWLMLNIYLCLCGESGAL